MPRVQVLLPLPKQKVRKALILLGFSGFFVLKTEMCKPTNYRKISYVFDCYVPPDVPPAEDRVPIIEIKKAQKDR